MRRSFLSSKTEGPRSGGGWYILILPKPKRFCGKLGWILLPGGREVNRNMTSPDRCFLAFFGSCDLVRCTRRRLSVSFFPPRVVGSLPALNESYSHAA